MELRFAARLERWALLSAPVIGFVTLFGAAFLTREVTLTDGELATLPLAVKVAAPVVLGFLLLGGLATWRMILTARELLGAATLTVLVAPLQAMCAVHVANARWDRSPPERHDVQITLVRPDTYYPTPDCEVGVAAWRPGAEGFTFMLVNDDCHGLVAGQSRATVTTRRGAFALEWVPRIEVRRAPRATE